MAVVLRRRGDGGLLKRPAARRKETRKEMQRKGRPGCQAENGVMRKVAILIGVLFLGCTKQHSTGTTGTTVHSDVVGSWRWVMQHNDGDWAGNWSGPPLGDTLTPQSTGIQEVLNLNANGTYSVVDNGRTVSRDCFILIHS